VAIARGEIQEEGLVGGDRVLRADPIDGTIGQVADQDVARVTERRQDWLGVLK